MKRKKLPDVNDKNPYSKVFTSMQKKLEKATKVLSKDLSKKKIDWEKVQHDSTSLMLLLGECNYFAKECGRCKKKGKWA